MKKTCTKCNTIKNLSYFNKDKGGRGGYCAQCKECRKNYGRKNSKYIKKYNDEYRKKNTKKFKELKKKYREENKEKISEYHSEYCKTRYANDIQFKLSTNLRRRMCKMIRRNQRAGSAVRDLGCSLVELKIHIESKFDLRMSWENYGEWHIDHIKPLSKFDLEIRSQFLEAAHYTNLQPLWAVDNIIKSNK